MNGVIKCSLFFFPYLILLWVSIWKHDHINVQEVGPGSSSSCLGTFGATAGCGASLGATLVRCERGDLLEHEAHQYL